MLLFFFFSLSLVVAHITSSFLFLLLLLTTANPSFLVCSFFLPWTLQYVQIKSSVNGQLCGYGDLVAYVYFYFLISMYVASSQEA